MAASCPLPATSPMVLDMNVLSQLQGRFERALTGLVAEPARYAQMLRGTQDAKFGDYQANCAMSLAKVLGKPPREVAALVVENLDLGDFLEKPEIAGPGFINLRLRNDWLAEQLQALAQDERLGVAPATTPKTYVVDFSSPNVAKPMHVGHLRSTIIGDALSRLLRFLGHTVVTDNHLGDWGAQFGILLYGYKNYLDEKAFQTNPVAELTRLYKLINQLFKKASDDDEGEDGADPIKEACRRETAKLHAGDPDNVRVWQLFMPYCHEEINQVYRRLDVKFDHTLGESFYNPLLADVVKSLREKGLAVESQGAVVIPQGENDPPAMIQKTDGAFTYTTTDLATIQYRVEQWHPDAILYVVDSRQALHFKSLFAIARQWGVDKPALEHISFGSVLGEDGKPLSTRNYSGDTTLLGLLNEATAQALRIVEANEEEQSGQTLDETALNRDGMEQVASVIGIGAVKYADLCQNRTSDYVFSWQKMLAMDGNTATYMQYAYARARSIFRKGQVDPRSFRLKPPLPTLDSPFERTLAIQIIRLAEVLQASATEYRSNIICAYLWDLAKSTSGFLQNCPVLTADTPELRNSRLLLCDLTARIIQLCLKLLGIQTIERM